MGFSLIWQREETWQEGPQKLMSNASAQTVRSDTPKNTDFLKSLATALPGKLEIVEADFDKEGSYNKAVQGAKYV